MKIIVSMDGDFKKVNTYFDKILGIFGKSNFDKYGIMGVEALRNFTPKRTGRTANSWGYEVKRSSDSVKIEWSNSNMNKGHNIAILIQYGHGTGWGTYVQGVDYINPAMRDTFEKIAEKMWKEVTNA